MLACATSLKCFSMSRTQPATEHRLLQGIKNFVPKESISKNWALPVLWNDNKGAPVYPGERVLSLQRPSPPWSPFTCCSCHMAPGLPGVVLSFLPTCLSDLATGLIKASYTFAVPCRVLISNKVLGTWQTPREHKLNTHFSRLSGGKMECRLLDESGTQ